MAEVYLFECSGLSVGELNNAWLTGGVEPSRFYAAIEDRKHVLVAVDGGVLRAKTATAFSQLFQPQGKLTRVVDDQFIADVVGCLHPEDASISKEEIVEFLEDCRGMTFAVGQIK